MWARKWSWMEPHSVQSFGADAWTADRWEVIPGTNVRTSLNVGPWAVTNQRAVHMPWKFLNPPWFSRNARRWGIISLNHSKAHLLMVSHFQSDAVGLFFFSVAVWQCETTMLIMVHTRDGHVLIGWYKVVPPKRYKLVSIHPMNTIDISPINHSYWSYLHQLNAIERGHHLV